MNKSKILPQSSEISIANGTKHFPAFFVSPEKKGRFPGVILIHEVWGLSHHIKDVATRFKDQGYCVVAPDLISHTGILEKIDQNVLKEVANPATRDEAQKKMRAAMAPIHSQEFGEETISKLKTCFKFLQDQQNCNGNIAVIGFCFGGTYSYALATMQPNLRVAVAFYGHAPQPLDRLRNITCPVLAFYGDKDSNLINGLPDLEKAMKEYGKNFEYKVYPNTGHAFFNDTNPGMYNSDAAQDSWQKVLTFLKKNLE